MQFQRISQFPNVSAVSFKLKMFATDEIGDTPNSPFWVIATPKAAINKLMTNSIYRFTNSFLCTFFVHGS